MVDSGALPHLLPPLAARGSVRPVSANDVHLAIELKDGSMVAGQHRITTGDTDGLPVTRRCPGSGSAHALRTLWDTLDATLASGEAA